jgi:hypothetical protein
MTDSGSSRGPNRPNDDPGVGGDGESPPATPRWVYAFGIIAVVLVLAFVVSHLVGGGFRGHSMP